MSTPPKIATPSVSAEQQWLESVVKPNQGSQRPSISLAPNTTVRTSIPPTPTRSSIRASSGQALEDYNSNITPFQQTPSQLAAQKRMEIMQKEVDIVIGMMNLNFEDKCVVAPDRRLSELYSQHCPEYDTKWKCGGRDETEDLEKKKRRKKFCIQLAVLLGILLLNAMFLLGDYVLSSWIIKNESDKELMEAALKKNMTNGTLEMIQVTELIHIDPTTQTTEGALVKEESTTITVIEKIEEENIEATIEGGDGGGGDVKELWGMIEGDNFPKGHDVLDIAKLKDNQEEEGGGPDLVASNDD